jgi:hypothetical protein
VALGSSICKFYFCGFNEFKDINTKCSRCIATQVSQLTVQERVYTSLEDTGGYGPAEKIGNGLIIRKTTLASEKGLSQLNKRCETNQQEQQ